MPRPPIDPRTPTRQRFLRVLTALTVVACALSGCRAGQAEPEGSPEAEPTGSGPLASMTIVLDPGHNGGNFDHPEDIEKQVDVANGEKNCDTTGTESDDGYREHAFNFDVATRLAHALRDAGATVVMTRDDDEGVGPCIDERTAVANDLGADAAVSIHADGGPDGGRGFHIMEPVPIDGHNEDVVEPSHELALALAAAVEEGTDMPPSDYIGDDGINPRDDMGGLNLTTVPKVMVECGNMRNAADAKLLTDAEFRQDLADALAEGVTAYLTS